MARQAGQRRCEFRGTLFKMESLRRHSKLSSAPSGGYRIAAMGLFWIADADSRVQSSLSDIVSACCAFFMRDRSIASGRFHAELVVPHPLTAMALKDANGFAGFGIQQTVRQAVGKSGAGGTTRPSHRALARQRFLIGHRRANHCKRIMTNRKRRLLLIG